MGKSTVLRETFKDHKVIDDAKKKYKSCSSCKLDNYELVTTPFRVLKLIDLISDRNYLERLTEELKELVYSRKDNDLYNLQQSLDLNGCNTESITNFVQLLRSNIEPLLANILGVTFNGTLSITASLYKRGEYLLCHDDRCDDRCVAFVYYLTESGGTDAGGHFRMFSHDEENGQPTSVTCSLPPKANSFICFEVGNYTYHEVGEILDDNFERLSINGWFHSDINLNIEGLNYTDPMPQLYKQVILETPLRMDEFVNRTYCSMSNVFLAQEDFEKDSFILLTNFCMPDIYKACAECLKCSDLTWGAVGPPNRRKYECVELETIQSSPLKKMIDYLRSPTFVSYLRDLTGLDLVPDAKKDGIACTEMTFQVQKWTPGSYTMATDNDAFFQTAGLDMILYFNCDTFIRGEGNYGGCTTYLASAQSENSSNNSTEDEELLTIEPQDNALILVYRTSDTVRFTKYINHFNNGIYHTISATYFES